MSEQPQPGDIRAAAVLHRHVLQLLVLVAAAAVAFWGARALAGHVADERGHDAAGWFDRGRAALAKQDIEGAVEAFRQATAKDPARRDYALPLADALIRGDHADQAHRVLQALRDTAPEDPAVNLALARLSGSQRDAATATRYYRNALYAPWADPMARRQARLEFVQFLLREQRPAAAAAELIAMRPETPDTVPAHVQRGALFTEAHEPAMALEEFLAALRLDPHDADALAGAGRTAFVMRDYAKARRYLQGATDPADRERLDVATAVIALDPLANRISLAERSRRMRQILDYAVTRRAACVAPSSPPPGDDTTAALQSAGDGLDPRRHPDLDTLDDDLELAYRAELSAIEQCASQTATGRAILEIGRLHELDVR